jgi:hypothetical protein
LLKVVTVSEEVLVVDLVLVVVCKTVVLVVVKAIVSVLVVVILFVDVVLVATIRQWASIVQHPPPWYRSACVYE